MLAPSDADAVVVDRRYIDSTFVLQATWETASGSVRVTDFMPLGGAHSSLVRGITGLTDNVEMRQVLQIRPGYGMVLPWSAGSVMRQRTLLSSWRGPGLMPSLCGGRTCPRPMPTAMKGTSASPRARPWISNCSGFPRTVRCQLPAASDIDAALEEAVEYWTQWGSHCRQDGPYGSAVKRSLLVLRALTHLETGGIVAAPTTSLPEDFGGARNWDYRCCWLRDAALTLESMLTHGYETEALQWRNWLLRVLAGDPEQMQIMYGVGGRTRTP